MSESPSRLTAILRKTARQFPYLPRTLGLVWTAAPQLTLVWLAMMLVLGLLPALTVWLSKPLVNGITAAMAAGGDWPAVRPVLLLGLVMAGLVLAGELLRATNSWIRTAQSERVRVEMDGVDLRDLPLSFCL